MSDAQLTHRLAAILAADVEGYTRLIADDEGATIKALGDARSILAERVTEHRGRVVDSAGDAFLAEFPSAIDAVRCSVSAQRTLLDRAATLPPERRVRYRIGVHLGDIAVEGERIYGDGVNVAARLEKLAEAGGVCISASVHEIVFSRMDLPFTDLGEQSLKNYPRPVRAYRLGGSDASILPASPLDPQSPDSPSLVVLPFANVSGDAEQEYFADGMSEDLISELARVPDMLVIGRGTSFAYKGKSLGARELGRELGVRYVVEGSVRRSGSRVRISARLTEASSAREIWSERYDRELGDVFAVQDEVVGGVVAQLRSALGAGIEHSPRGRPIRPDVWELLVHARAKLNVNSPADSLAARELLLRCVSLDPGLPLGWAELAGAESLLHLLAVDGENYLELGLQHVEQSLAMDSQDARAHATLASLLLQRDEHEAALRSGRRALELAANDAAVRLRIATVLISLNRLDEAIPLLKNLTRLDPAERYMHLFQLGLAYNRQGRVDEAIAKHRECLALNPAFFGAHMQLTAIYGRLGELQHARESLAELLRVRPDFSIARLPRVQRRELLIEGLRKAGLSEE